VQLIIDRSRICEVLDFAKRLNAKRDAVIKLVLELLVVLKLYALNCRVIPDLADKEGVESRAVTILGVSHKWTEEDFVRGILHCLIKCAKGKRKTVSFRFDERTGHRSRIL